VSGGTATAPPAGGSTAIFAIAAQIMNAQPASLNAMAQRWLQLSTIAANSADGMEASLNTLMQSWQSSRAQPAFESNTRPLITTLRSVSTGSAGIGAQLEQAGTDLAAAQKQMAALLQQAQALMANGPLDYAGLDTAFATLAQEAAQIVQTLSGQYDQVAATITTGVPTYAGPTAPGTSNPGVTPQNSPVNPVPQIPNLQSASTTGASTTPPATPVSGTTPTTGLTGASTGTTAPASATIPTSTLPGGTGGITTTVPIVPTTPTIPTVGTGTVGTITPSLSAFPETLLSTGTLGYGGGYSGGFGASLGPTSFLTPADTPASTLPSQQQGTDTAATATATEAFPQGEGGTQGSATGAAGMPFMPGGVPASGAHGAGSGRRGPKLGDGLFDDEPPPDRDGRATAALREGVVEAEEDEPPITAFAEHGTVGPRRARSRASGADDDWWALPTGLAEPILASDRTQG
jgi:hypothetical protein